MIVVRLYARWDDDAYMAAGHGSWVYLVDKEENISGLARTVELNRFHIDFIGVESPPITFRSWVLDTANRLQDRGNSTLVFKEELTREEYDARVRKLNPEPIQPISRRRLELQQ